MTQAFRRLIPLLALGLGVLAAAGCSLDAVAMVSVPAAVKLGFVAPVSGPGQAAGNRLVQAAQLAVARQNAQGGVAGHPVELVVQDDHTAGGGAQVAQWLARDPAVLAVAGHLDGPSAATALDVYRETRLAAAILGSLNGPPSPPLPPVLRLAADNATVADAAVRFAAGTLEAATVAVVAGPNPEDARRADRLQQAVQAAGLQVVHSESLFPASTTYAGAVARLAAVRPDVLLVAAGLPEAAAFWREASGAARAAMFPNVSAASASEFAAVAGSAARTAYLPVIELDAGVRPDRAAVAAAYRERWGAEPDAATLLTYDAASLLLEAMDRAMRHHPGDLRTAVRDELPGLRDFSGVTGLLQFDENGGIKDTGLKFQAAIP